MIERGREVLKDFFRNGKKPTESDFSDLIDSTVNKLDDGYTKSDIDGLKLTAKGNSKTLITLCENEKKTWRFFFEKKKLVLENQLDKTSKERTGLKVITPETIIEGDIILHGDVSVKGILKGTHETSFPADGQWHTVSKLNYGVYALEITASVEGRSGNGKYAVLLGWATQAFGSNRKIKTMSSHYGFWGNRMKLRWKKVKDDLGDFNYQLQICTKLNYNDPIAQIKCNLTFLHKYEKNR